MTHQNSVVVQNLQLLFRTVSARNWTSLGPVGATNNRLITTEIDQRAEVFVEQLEHICPIRHTDVSLRSKNTVLDDFPHIQNISEPNILRYKRVVTPRRAGVAVVMCWMVAFIVGLTPMLGWNNLKRLQENGSISSNLSVTCQFETVISMDYMVYFNFFGWVLPPLLLMLAIYAEIFYMIHKQLNNKKNTSSYSDPNKYYDKELNLAKSLVLVLFLFAISWLPLHIINCITLFCPQCKKPNVLLYIAILLSHGNSAVNPIVYAFRIKKFHTAFQKIWQQYFCCKNTLTLDFQQSERKEAPNLETQQAAPLQPTQLDDFKSYPPLQPEQPSPEGNQKIKTPQKPHNHHPAVEQNAV
ncbi:adenosine receptor A1-like [Nothobranchius furzeri]|uniref:adenosine receptor A1-like n=1 Tax=Nothobranchius furzeri TaxID=105023 RepID=UPI003904BE21